MKNNPKSKKPESASTASQGAAKSAGNKATGDKQPQFEKSWKDADYNEGGTVDPKGGRAAKS